MKKKLALTTKFFLFFVFIVTTLTFLTINTASAMEAPDEIVRRSTNEIFNAIKSDKEIQSGNVQKLEHLLNEKIFIHFNFPHMTKLALGRNWRDASEVQKSDLSSQFKFLLVRTYSTALAQYINQKVEVKPLKLSPSDVDVVVKTNVSQASGQVIPIDYSMENTPTGWKAYDILIDGVSLVTNYRSSFNAEIQKSGIDGLIQALKQRTAKNATKNKLLQ